MKRITLVHEDLRLTNVVRRLSNAINSIVSPVIPGSWNLVHSEEIIIASTNLFQTVSPVSGWIQITDGSTPLRITLPILKEGDKIEAYLCAGMTSDIGAVIGLSTKVDAAIIQGGGIVVVLDDIPGTFAYAQPGNVNVQYPGYGTLVMPAGITLPVLIRGVVKNAGSNPAEIWGDISLIVKVWRQQG